MQLFYGNITGDRFYLHESEIHHCTRVLRKDTGDVIHFITGDGSLYSGTIDVVSKRSVEGFFNMEEEHWGALPYTLTIAVAPTKNMDRFEWFIEKSIELGVSRIIPLRCDRSERKVIKEDRLFKVALSAAKQSLKGRLPKIEPLTSFKDFIAMDLEGTRCIAHCEDSERTAFSKVAQADHLVVLIGPEGDFSPNEVLAAQKAGFKPIHLGRSRLRTETAALTAVSMVYAAHL
ncbi:MAG: 16S rRNA (uracil(1498)-N(3))-methyltransferase [Schleiferiaceae bacterium]|nr:16S rRNA (uracil(1498)-N(3))-methyltransferase [Schleiferiaceae bacterium]